MGARISGIGSNLLEIEGVDCLGGCKHTILPDMIEIGSFIGMAAMTGSDYTPQKYRRKTWVSYPTVSADSGFISSKKEMTCIFLSKTATR